MLARLAERVDRSAPSLANVSKDGQCTPDPLCQHLADCVPKVLRVKHRC